VGKSSVEKVFFVAMMVFLGLGCKSNLVPTKPSDILGSELESPSKPDQTDPPIESLPEPLPEPPSSPTLPPTPLPVSVVTMIGAGDIGWCGLRGAEETGKLLDGVPGATVFTLGDNAYMNGSMENFMQCYDPFWGRFKNRTRPALGNHDYQTPGAQDYFRYFGMSSSMAYYSFELGGWHIVVMDTSGNIRGGSVQLAWLRQDLSKNSKLCTLVYQHYPLISSGPNGDNFFLRDEWNILQEFKVDLVLAGHDHFYERFGKLDSDGRPSPNGIRQIIAGTGGARLYDFQMIKPGSENRASVWGVLKLVLSPVLYQWEFIPIQGETFRDFGKSKCQ